MLKGGLRGLRGSEKRIERKTDNLLILAPESKS